MADDPADLLARYRRLTLRQQTLVRSLADAASRAEIAEALGISLSLVDKETAEVMRAFDLQEEGLTRTQRCLELRRMYLQIRRLERSEATPTEPIAPAGGEPVTAPPEPASSAGQEGAATAEQPAPLVLLPPPIPTPPASSAAWRWWPLAAAVLLLALIAGAWRMTHSAGQSVQAGATATSTTESTPAVAAAVPVRTPTVAPSPTLTPVPPSPTATPTPVPTATATINPAASPVNLAGKVASTRPGTPLRLGQPVASVIDQQAKPYDVYALQLRAGQTLHVEVAASSDAFGVTIAAAGAQDLLGEPGIPLGAFLCNFQDPCRKDFAIAADGTYTLVVGTNEGAGIRYTLEATAR